VIGGLQDGNFTGIDTGFKARITRFNSEGGLNGRKIQFLGVLNDGNSLSTDLANAQTLVLKDHVFAVAPVADQVLNPSSATLFAQHTTPFVGWDVTPDFCGNNWSFPLVGCESDPNNQNLLPFQQEAQLAGKPAKGLRVAVIGIDNSGAKIGLVGLVSGDKAAGGNVVYAQAQVPQGGTTDYTPYVQALMATHPDLIQLEVDFQTSIGLTAALRRAGYTGALWNPTAYVPGLFASQPSLAQALNGSIVLANFPPAEDSSAAVDQVQSDLKAIGASPVFNLGESVGWWAGEELIQELQATAAKGPLTQANFEKVINSGWTIKAIPGGISGLTFPRDHTWPTPCDGALVIQGTQYIVKSKYTCDPNSVVNVGG
jgi:hypothetical protein